MAKWDVIFSNCASSRTVKKTVEAGCKTQAVLTAQSGFEEPDQWKPVVAAPVPAEYYDRIDRVRRIRDAEIEELADEIERERESFAAYNDE